MPGQVEIHGAASPRHSGFLRQFPQMRCCRSLGMNRRPQLRHSGRVGSSATTGFLVTASTARRLPNRSTIIASGFAPCSQGGTFGASSDMAMSPAIGSTEHPRRHILARVRVSLQKIRIGSTARLGNVNIYQRMSRSVTPTRLDFGGLSHAQHQNPPPGASLPPPFDHHPHGGQIASGLGDALGKPCGIRRGVRQ